MNARSGILLACIALAAVLPLAAEPSKPTALLITLGEQAAWQDFAYLAAVPATFQANQGAGAAIALEAKGGISREVDDYLRRLKPAGICHLGEQPLAQAPAHSKLLELGATSAQQAAVVLAETFWKSSQRVPRPRARRVLPMVSWCTRRRPGGFPACGCPKTGSCGPTSPCT
jgi:hypothetical protein